MAKASLAKSPRQKTRPAPNEPANASQTKVVLLVTMAVLIIVPIAVFSSVTAFQFLGWDDDKNVTQSPLYQPTRLAHIADIWTKPYFASYLPLTRTIWALLADQTSGPQGRPLVTFDPSKYHMANLYVHIANVVLVFLLLRVLLSIAQGRIRQGITGSEHIHDEGQKQSAGEAERARMRKGFFGIVLPAALGALLFSIHPLQVEPVAWVSGLRDLLCAFFSLFAILCYLVAIHRDQAMPRRRLWLAGASACYLLALLSKSSAVVLPLILLLMDYVLNHSVPKGRLVFLAIWLGPAIAISLITKNGEGVPLMQSTSAGMLRLVPFWQRPFVAGDTIGFYLWKLLAPYPLAVDYSRTPAWVMSHSWAYLPIIAPIALTLLAWRFRKQAPWLTLAIGIFLISIVPVSGIVPFVFQGVSTVADRYMYFAMLGPAMALAAIVAFARSRAVLPIAAVALVALGYLTARQVPVWANTGTLFTHNLEVNPSSALSYIFVGLQNEQTGHLDNAIADNLAAIRLNPDFWLPEYNLGLELYKKWVVSGAQPAQQGLLTQAQGHFLRCIQITGGYEPAVQSLGRVYLRMNRIPEAIGQYEKAIQEEPGDPENYVLLAVAYARSGQTSKAAAYMQKAAGMRYNPAIRALSLPMQKWQ